MHANCGYKHHFCWLKSKLTADYCEGECKGKAVTKTVSVTCDVNILNKYV